MNMNQNNQTNGGSQKEFNLEALKKYATNLIEQARAGRLDPVVGRDEEIRRVLQILSRRTKNNPILVGEPGTGKTAIVEGLAHRILRGDVPENLKDCRRKVSGRVRGTTESCHQCRGAERGKYHPFHR